VHQILQPLGLEEVDLISLVHDNHRQLALWSQEESWNDGEIKDSVDIHF
jgi:hypothetical protein